MNVQLAFLLCLGADENRRMDPDKAGFTSDMLAYPENEKLWHEARQPLSLTNAIYAAIDEMGSASLDIAVDGTVFPPEDEPYESRWKEIIAKACEEIALEISFDGYGVEESMAMSCNKELFTERLVRGELQIGYSSWTDGVRSCILTDKQVLKLAVMSVQLGAFRMELYEIIEAASPLFGHWLSQVKKHELGSRDLGRWLEPLKLQEDTELLMQLILMRTSFDPSQAEQEGEFVTVLERLEGEAFAIDGELRASLFNALEDNAFAAVRQIAALLEINRLVSLFFAGLGRNDLDTFTETAKKFLASMHESEWMRVDAVPSLGTIDLYGDAYYPL